MQKQGFFRDGSIAGLFGVIILISGVSRVSAVDYAWEPEIYPKENIFPSLIIGTARVDPEEEVFAIWKGNHLGDPQGVVGASVEGLEAGDEVELVVEAGEVFRKATIKGEAEEAGDYMIHPKIPWNYNRLVAVRETEPMDVTMELFVNGESQGVKTTTVTLRPVHDCLFAVEEDEETNSDYSWLFSAYVNENHPWVDRILKQALETGIVSSFDGYQSGDAETVLLQIFAIWNVMQRLGMTYSDITTTAAESDGVYSQHVRLFEDSVNASQANCVDGSVLLGALLRKIGLSASLVLVPGHMLLAVDLDDETTIGIETTLMGEKNLKEVAGNRHPAFENLGEVHQEEAWEAFENAVAAGTESLEENLDLFDDEDALQHQIINLEFARKVGILPIKSANASD